MSYRVYSVELPEHPEAVTFIQGIVARNLFGLLWLWRHLLWIRKSNVNAAGCIQAKAGDLSRHSEWKIRQ